MNDIKIGVAQVVALSDKVDALEDCTERVRLVLKDLIKHFNGDLADEEETARVIYEHDMNRVRVDIMADYLLQIAEEIGHIRGIIDCIEGASAK